jgi:hypothetical protein
MTTMIRPRLASRTGAGGAKSNIFRRTVALINGTHTGVMFSTVGFVWFFAAAIVLLSDTLTSVWGPFAAILACWLIGGRTRVLLRRHPNPGRPSCE